MRAIVTGGAGFIGSHIVDALLARGDEVLVVDDLSSGKRENLDGRAELVVADIRDEDAVETAFASTTPELCFHLAAQSDVRFSVSRPDFDCEVNVLGTIRLLEAARRHGTRIVFSSTGGAMYGECAEPAPESKGPELLAPYGASKLAGEQYLATYNRLHGASHVSLRYGNVYGPRQDPDGEAGVVAIFLGRLARGEAPHVFGDGAQQRDYVYVADVVAATLAAAEARPGVVNVGTGIATSVLDLLDACLRATGMEIEPVFDPPRLGELQRSVLDPGLAEQVLGVRATTTFDDGIAATWESMRAQKE